MEREYEQVSATGYGLQGISGTGLKIAADKRDSEINSVIIKLHRAVELAKTNFSDLYTSLAPILGPQTDLANEKAVNPEYFTPLAQEINKSIRELESLIDGIRDTRKRVEV